MLFVFAILFRMHQKDTTIKKGFNPVSLGTLEHVVTTRFNLILYFNLSKRAKKDEKGWTLQISHSKKPGREKVFSFTTAISIAPPNYSLIPESYFKLLFSTQLLSDIVIYLKK